MSRLFVVMGVSGCGKSSVARALAEKTGGRWLDADDFHPPANKRKMAAGIPLTDEDRWGWLAVLHERMQAHAADSQPFFLACSALRKIYRERLADDLPVQYIYLHGSRDLLETRMKNRVGHFMPPKLLESQLATLEEPEGAIVLEITHPVAQLVEEAIARAGLRRADANG